MLLAADRRRSRTRGCRRTWRRGPRRSRHRSPACPRAGPSWPATRRRCRRRRAAAPGRAARRPPRRTSSPAAPRRRPVRCSPSIVQRRRIELAVEVVEADERHERARPAVLQQVEPHHALAVLRLGHAQQVRDRRREVDRAHAVDACPRPMPSPPARNVARMLMLCVEVLHVGHVAVLAEERRERDERARGRRVELVRRVGERDDVAGARRVRHVGRAAVGPLGM